MKKKHLFVLALFPLVLSSCGGNPGLSVDQMKEVLKSTTVDAVYPYYRVRGVIDYNNTYIQVDHEFTNDFREFTFVPYTRYNPGCFDPSYDPLDVEEEDILNYSNGSRAYWTRMPMRVNSKNFYGTVKDGQGVDTLNSTSSYSLIFHYMKSWSDSQVKNADSDGNMVMEEMKDTEGNVTGFTFYGLSLHSKITIDNYPEYPDPANTAHWPTGIDYDFYGPFPMYGTQVDAIFNFRFEYNKQGWLTREQVYSINYQDGASTDTHFYCEALYTYSFE